MKIYLDVHKEKGIKYIEDEYSSADIIGIGNLDKELARLDM